MDFKSMWNGLARGARWGLGIGVAVILAGTVGLGYWALHTDYEILFAKLSAQDAAAMTKELDQMKVAYRLGEDGTTILVDRSSVHQTRLKLMGKDLPLHGAVGFELFNNADFGMTEFAQKVNYQRALQGELTRTILSLAEVESARVHLAFPEEGLFKREQRRAKASITLTLKDGRSLRREQVRGIQRLVAAAVPGIESRDVTLVSDQGVALTQDDDDTASGALPASRRLELKREIEQYLAQKANTLLDKAFGPGRAMASVDVTLDMNQVKVTTEDVTTPPPGEGEGPVGVVLRERETTRDSNRASNLAVGDASGPTTTQREIDYQLGRRVEQVVSSPGAITRLQALAVLRAPLSPTQVEQVRELLANAVGATREREDVVVVQPLDGLAATVAPASVGAPVALDGGTGGRGSSDGYASNPVQDASAAPGVRAQEWFSAGPAVSWAATALGLLITGALAYGLGAARRRRTANGGGSAASLTDDQREAAVAKIRAWLAQEQSAAPSGTQPARSGQ